MLTVWKKLIYRSLMEYRKDIPQALPSEHITHCLDSLRNDIMCHADDTPRYTTSTCEPVTGVGQYRQCRDWAKLEAWAKERHACYRYGDPTIEDKKPLQLGRMKYCPKDSPYLPTVRKYFGKGKEWYPADL